MANNSDPANGKKANERKPMTRADFKHLDELIKTKCHVYFPANFKDFLRKLYKKNKANGVLDAHGYLSDYIENPNISDICDFLAVHCNETPQTPKTITLEVLTVMNEILDKASKELGDFCRYTRPEMLITMLLTYYRTGTAVLQYQVLFDQSKETMPVRIPWRSLFINTTTHYTYDSSGKAIPNIVYSMGIRQR